jgi:hypothetical protein
MQGKKKMVRYSKTKISKKQTTTALEMVFYSIRPGIHSLLTEKQHLVE